LSAAAEAYEYLGRTCVTSVRLPKAAISCSVFPSSTVRRE
jgi:hypothetical protein